MVEEQWFFWCQVSLNSLGLTDHGYTRIRPDFIVV